MNNKQIAHVVVIILAIFFIGASVTSSKIKTLKKIGAGSITNPYLGNNAVNSAKIQDGTVSNSDLADNVISTGKIIDGQVTADDITDGAVADADVSGSAGIAGTKISPNFGGQNIATTGTGTFGSSLSNNIDARDSGTALDIGLSNSSYIDMWDGVFTDEYLSAEGDFYLTNSSAASSDSATNATSPSETCNSALIGRIEWVDDTNAAGAWLYICEKTGASSYGWYKIQP